jgi:hypothetical protein
MDKFQIVDVPGIGEVEFPDSMSDADVVAAVRKLTSAAGKPSDAAPSDIPTPMRAAAPEDYRWDETPERGVAGRAGRAAALAGAGLAKGALEGAAWIHDTVGTIPNKIADAVVGEGVGPRIPARMGRAAATIDSVVEPPKDWSEKLLAGGAELLGGAVATPAPAIAPVAPARIAAREFVTPGETGGLVTRGAEKIVGKLGREGVASRVNATTVSERIAAELGLPKGAEITKEALKAVRDDAGRVYATVKGLPERVIGDKPYITKLRSVWEDVDPDAPKEVRDYATKVQELVGDAWRTDLSAKDTVNNMRRLRAKSDLETDVDLRRVMRTIANAQDELLERNIADPTLAKKLREARTKIAQSYDVEKSLTKAGDEVDARKLAQRRTKKPMTGGLDDAADFAGHNPGAAKPPSTLGDDAGGNLLADLGYALVALKASGSSTAAIGGFLARSTTRPMLQALYERAATRGNTEAATAAARLLAISQSGKLTADKARVAAGAMQVLHDYSTKQQEQK